MVFGFVGWLAVLGVDFTELNAGISPQTVTRLFADTDLDLTRPIFNFNYATH
jgi:hypothetical protein